MVSKRRNLDIYRSALPYTPDDAERIQRTGRLEHLDVFARPENETGFYLNDLGFQTILQWPPGVPEHDPRGHPSAPRFEHWKKAQDSKIGIAGNYFSFKGGGMVPCHSALEHRHLSAFEMNPFVVEIRTQYPEWSRDFYQMYSGLGLRMPKRALMTIDFVLTVKKPGYAGFHYHAVSTKPYEQLQLPGVKRRHQREAALLMEWGCTHEVMTQHSVTVTHALNSRRLISCMRYVEDIASYRDAASAMAVSLQSGAACLTCDQQIERVSELFGWTRNEGYRIFAIANFLGYLTLNHQYELLPSKPLYLLKSSYLANVGA